MVLRLPRRQKTTRLVSMMGYFGFRRIVLSPYAFVHLFVPPAPPPPDADPRGGAHGGYYGAPQNGYGAAGYGSRGADPYSARAGSSGAGPAAGSPATGYGGGYGGAPSAATPAAAAAPTPEEAALDKYWRDYITWEDQFKSYHQRVPTREEGAQDVPPQYRSGRSGAGGAPPSGGEERRDGSGRYGGVPPPR